MPRIEPFPVRVPEQDLTDLRLRLDLARLPTPEPVEAVHDRHLDRLEILVDAWRQHDWRSLEQRWNAIPHYRAHIDGLGIAFWHVPSPERTAVPLVLTHGWPGSPLEFETLIGPLTDPVAHGGSADQAFHLVIPSLPGFGFSDRPLGQDWSPCRTAQVWSELMTALGYERFAAHGGDWGAFVSIELARLFPERVIGLHLTMPLASATPEDRVNPRDADRRVFDHHQRHLVDGFGFEPIQSIRPQTLAYSLQDSPVGLASWLGEKLVASSDTRPEAGGGVSVEQQVDNIALYWLTGTAASTARCYRETKRWAPGLEDDETESQVTVPTACTLFPAEPYPIARQWAERRFSNLIQWNEVDRGGHFPGWEQPELLTGELRRAFRRVDRTCPRYSWFALNAS
ncbi:epoxide hydrolase family protein [Lentzea albida]|uniref:Pimeloyl-ACP methyl ester carboxylesterase n=1 Tax=Lentzea albida TaxID=65499 RepID=A0A1H9W999_9PSEU|nr:epoxide hydrolase [Lentzea albida]SES30468.1 Pimeloyl-ACP methyl ester carboxylesterase [Lentzea albida]